MATFTCPGTIELRDILEQDLKDKPRHIYEKFINSYDGKYPSDLPLNKHGDPDDTKISTTEIQEKH